MIADNGYSRRAIRFYPRRDVVEHCVSRLEQGRALATGYAKTGIFYRRIVDLATLLIRLGGQAPGVSVLIGQSCVVIGAVWVAFAGPLRTVWRPVGGFDSPGVVSAGSGQRLNKCSIL
ncbi:hypothetical protein LX15_006265 [Streptoalloteichus tenebrarius]|uniref:Transposase n=1 Tax=Streptoalloteichus tenebrarius (strain ATCC 17920 / DSM 40477 / JCM 4838 / CBS 697.72 / NBRC 16177 / NCIMB 11028 / NRRL B-12390 / A12253. 1 / ISP 5477) TaxID=1933 RepID=A0ABT1I456_STRSD|nr:hypothetical protein [Streptoalloteichus tenebrarius]BFE99121.1 hypothetical protein GCM10020241_07970 [Streptoalloteichus tenebrarius]